MRLDMWLNSLPWDGTAGTVQAVPWLLGLVWPQKSAWLATRDVSYWKIELWRDSMPLKATLLTGPRIPCIKAINFAIQTCQQIDLFYYQGPCRCLSFSFVHFLTQLRSLVGQVAFRSAEPLHSSVAIKFTKSDALWQILSKVICCYNNHQKWCSVTNSR